MSNTPPDEFKPRSHWGRMPTQTFSLSPKLPSAKPAAPPRPASSILSGAALPIGPAFVPPAAAPEPEPPPVAIWRADVAPEEEGEPPLLDEVTIVAPRRAKRSFPWLIGGAVAAVAIVGGALLLRPQSEPVTPEPALEPVVAAPAPTPVTEMPALETPLPEPIAQPQAAAPPRQVAAVTRAPSAPRARVEETAALPNGPVAYGQAQPRPQPVTPTPAPTTRLESIVPTPIQPPVARPPVDPNAPLETNDSY